MKLVFKKKKKKLFIDKKVHKAQVNDNKMPKPEAYMA